jgi:hypothetical protein
MADDAFALSVNIMKPYAGHNPGSSTPERIFNYRLQKTCITVENMFGILSGKFRVFSKPVTLHPNKIETVLLTCIYIHNFPRWNTTSRNFYLLPGTCCLEDMYNHTVIPGSWKSETEDKHGSLSLQNVPRSSLNVAKILEMGFGSILFRLAGGFHGNTCT